MFKKILLATDGSVHALRAAIKAADIAKMNLEANISVVYVLDGTRSKLDILSVREKEEVQEKLFEKNRPTEELQKRKM
jgi:nucleotide-binding universal stress UspA family protein